MCHFPIILKFHFYEFFEQPEYNYFMYKIKGPLTVYGFKNFVNLFIQLNNCNFPQELLRT